MSHGGSEECVEAQIPDEVSEDSVVYRATVMAVVVACAGASFSQGEAPRRAGVRYGESELSIGYFPYVGAAIEGGSWGVVLGAALWAQHPLFVELQHFPHGDIQDAQAFVGAHYSLRRSPRSAISVLLKAGPRFTLEFADDATYYDQSGFAIQPGVSVMTKSSERAILSAQLGWKAYTEEDSDSGMVAIVAIGLLF